MSDYQCSKTLFDINSIIPSSNMSGINAPEVYVQFHHTGFFRLSVAATNACGTGVRRSIDIFLFGGFGDMRESTTYTQSRPISSGVFHVLLNNEEGARTQDAYNVRIYDSSGHMVKQGIAENGRVEFDLSDLPGGTYYLYICNGVDEPMIQPIVVENRSEWQ